ncbi:DUF4844 domain-containing protein [Epilithonimonas sp. JDS]|uniref:DUF4844 domain-containing protein n=1 Tax=Epilithonimonas sp. JDS TaxID=2902797 RepID=UPI001E5732FB|nr:DUF4844 domain-containing protein [Epilithonimonas sp. JDS]MCD9855278.1 DUF4844 domain-containing protein [Epilithonimonas sp. JDS]
MTDKQITLDKLEAFKNLNKFSYSAWEQRGLNPSANEISDKLEILFNKCTDELINAINLSLRTKQLKLILKQNLESLSSSDFDTEEREFICDYFDQLSKIVSVEFKNNLNGWLYGNLLNTLFKFSSFFKGKVKDKEILSQDCTKCNSKLETFITKKEVGIPDYSWKIIQCHNCKEFNLLSTGPNIKELRFGNYKLIEQLLKTEFNEEEAKIRLNQIKVFRKH